MLKSGHYYSYYCQLLRIFCIINFCVFGGNKKPLYCFIAGIMARPLESTDDIAMKFRVLQFISRINEGENLGEININQHDRHI